MNKMSKYVSGILEKNEPGAIFEGHIWNRYLEFRASDDTVITIFDFDNISGELKVGQTYHLVICLVASPKYSGTEPIGTTPETWSGEIIDLAWDSTKESFQYWTPKVHYKSETNPWILVKCRIGNIITYLGSTEDQMVYSGGFLYWESCRWDLYGILANPES
ncbi:MAG: hypothetical protein K8I82_16920 [Anaerolineae bacterium]|nr:hypothetical protein [Anaerolineae bacterium]